MFKFNEVKVEEIIVGKNRLVVAKLDSEDLKANVRVSLTDQPKLAAESQRQELHRLKPKFREALLGAIKALDES